ncbi:hypothetical protein GGI15_003225 [Coemansia interrupta]|uniref:Autophagy-related protein 101 n=1 Tax=Coemansia interrupta TaxID=1126814 RepID=A0A9W8HGA0_9FUNG|nr:hypothetical protein GGI15_003225 [Coemansia interrupta]
MDHRVIKQSLVLERSLVPSVVKAVLHTILFHRYFGNVTPQENLILSDQVTYVSVDDADVVSTVDGKVQELMQALQQDGGKSQVTVSFSETRGRKASWFGGAAAQSVCWEEWVVDVQAEGRAPGGEEQRTQRRQAVDQAKHAIFAVIRQADAHKDHIPLISSSKENPFPYHITVAPAAGLWSSMIKRAILPGIS